jgi:hypothetical protein
VPAKTAAPYELIYTLAADEPKTYPTTAKEAAERVAEVIEKKIGGILSVKARGASYNAVAGELGVVSVTAQTVTLPAVAANLTVGVFSLVAETKIATSGGAKIAGDFINEEATIKLSTNQHVILQSDGTRWLIVGGEPKREGTYAAQVTRASATPYTPSASRPTMVALRMYSENAFSVNLEVGGQSIGGAIVPKPASGFDERLISFECPAGIAWQVTTISGSPVYASSYLTR